MTKKDIQKFNKLIQKTFNGDEDTFEVIMDILVNMMVQENIVSNQELMYKIQRYGKNEQQINSYFGAYSEFSNKLISELDRLQTISSGEEYEKEFKKFVKIILVSIPKNELKEYIYTAMDDFFDIINDEYNIGAIPFDNNFEDRLEKVFNGIRPMFELYIIIGQLLAKDEDNKNQIIDKDELFEQAVLLFSFVQFANITRIKTAIDKKEIAMEAINQIDYKSQKIKSQIYQLKISIKGAKPPIWRRVLVKSNITFRELHNIIQNIFNWENYHLYQFDGTTRCYTDEQTAEDRMGYKEEVDAIKYQISDELEYEKDKIKYTYDFGDDWEHDILLEKVLEVDKNINYPICTAGRRNGPLEDCGGMWGYRDILYAIETKKFNEFEYLLDDDGDFYYKDFDPAYFNKEEINKRLKLFI
ncbi:MAG: plasmid pRiA4b ORF-3 family protein [Campylobacterota bacterium]|nr:plasmid pRiA4b ORF-3 family protein [Campylobacterota bacterium]